MDEFKRKKILRDLEHPPARAESEPQPVQETEASEPDLKMSIQQAIEQIEQRPSEHVPETSKSLVEALQVN